MQQKYKLWHRVLFRLGGDPDKSWRRFFIGLIAFWFSAILTWFSQDVSQSIFYACAVLIIPSFIYALWGYVGIFSNRFGRLIEQGENFKKVTSTQSKDSPKHTK